MKKTLRKIALIVVMAAAVVFATVSGGKWGMKDLVYTIALPLALVVSCKNEPETSVNKPPTANAGEAQTVKLRNNLSITLDGSQSSDSDGTIKDYVWKLKTAPEGVDKNSVIITNDSVNLGKANVTGITTAGDYIFELTVTDNEGASSTANVTVVVELGTDSRNLTTASSTFTPNTELDFVVPTFNNETTMWSDFNVNDITWTFTCSLGKDLSTYATNKQSIPASIYPDEAEPTITQVFKYKGNTVGQRVIETLVCTNVFMYVKVDDDEYNSIPVLSLPFSRTVPELP